MKRGKLVLSVLFAVSLAGCRVVLPAHSDSLDTVGERVKCNAITEADLDPSIKPAFDALFPDDEGFGPAVAALAPVVEFLFDAAAKFVKKEVEAEAARYEAQYSGSVTLDQFFDENNGLRYRGVEIRRTTARTRAAEREEKAEKAKQVEEAKLTEAEQAREGGTSPSQRGELGGTAMDESADSEPGKEGDPDGEGNRIVFAMHKDVAGQKLLITPAYVRYRTAKAKILTDQPWSYAWTFLWRVFMNSGSEVSVSCAFDFDYLARNEKGELSSQRITKEVGLPALDIGDDTELFVGRGLQSSPAFEIPLPVKGKGENATLSIRITVTERDPSNAKQVLKIVSDAIDKYEPKAREYVLKLIGVEGKEGDGKQGEGRQEGGGQGAEEQGGGAKPDGVDNQGGGVKKEEGEGH